MTMFNTNNRTTTDTRRTRGDRGRRSGRPWALALTLVAGLAMATPATAQDALGAGDVLDGIGGDTCYGVAADLAEGAELLPIGLSGHAVMRRPVGIDRPVTLDDVELDEDAFLVRLHREMA